MSPALESVHGGHEDDPAQFVLRIIVPYCAAFGRAKLRCICRKWRDTVDATSPTYTLPRATALQSRDLLAARPLLTSLTLTPSHLQHRPDLHLLESHLTSLTVRSNMRGAAWQRSGQGAVLLLLARLAPLRRLQHLTLADCLVADRWDQLAALRRLRDLDLGGVLEVDNRLLTVLPLLSRLQALTLPGAEGYSPRYNHCSAHGFLLCLHHLKSLSPPAVPAVPAVAASLRRSSGMPVSASCGNLVRMAAVAEAADLGSRLPQSTPAWARPESSPTRLHAGGVSVTPNRSGMTRLEFRGLPYRRHGPEALRHSRPCPLTDGAVVAALVETLPGLQVLSLEEVGGTAGHVVKAPAGSRSRIHVPTYGCCTATAEVPNGGAMALGRVALDRSPAGEERACTCCGAGGSYPQEESAAGSCCPLLHQSRQFEVLSCLTSLTSLTVSAHVQLEYRDGEARAPTGGSATAPLCDGLLVRWLQPAADGQAPPPPPPPPAAGAGGATSSAPRSSSSCRVSFGEATTTTTTTTAATNTSTQMLSPGVPASPWRALTELALREVWELGPTGLAAVCGSGALPALRCLDLSGSGRGLGLMEAAASLERLTGLQRLRLARATCCAWCLPDPFGGRLLEEDECARSVSEPGLSGSCTGSGAATAAAAAAAAAALRRLSGAQQGPQSAAMVTVGTATAGSLSLGGVPQQQLLQQQQQHHRHRHLEVLAGSSRNSGRTAVVDVSQTGHAHGPLKGDGGRSCGGGDGGGGGGGFHSQLPPAAAPVSEEFYQDIDWDAFEDAQHSSVVDFDDGIDPWVSRPSSFMLQQLPSGATPQLDGTERPRTAARSVRALTAAVTGTGAAQQPLPGPGVGAMSVGGGGGGGGSLRSAAAEVLRYHHEHQHQHSHPHPHLHRALDAGRGYSDGRRSADFAPFTRMSNPHLQHHHDRNHRQQPQKPYQLQYRASADAGPQPCGRAPGSTGVYDDPWVSRRGTPHRALSGPRSVMHRLIASHRNWVIHSRLFNGSPDSGQTTTEAEVESRLDDDAGCEVAAAVRRMVTAMPDLQDLDLGGWPVTAGVVRQLASSEGAPAAVAMAAGMKPRVRLQRLGLAGCQLDVTLAAALGGLQDLQYLDISSTRPEAAFIAALAGLSSLEEVEVRGCRLLYDSGKALQQLSAVKAVRGLTDTTGLSLVTELNGEHVLL